MKEKSGMMQRKSWGLVLSGGGGKGAYQIGVIKALKEVGLLEWITAVSGSSIGAFNAILLSQDNLLLMEQIWSQIKPEHVLDFGSQGESLLANLEDKYKALRSFFKNTSFTEYLEAARQEGICSRDAVVEIVKNNVDLNKIRMGKRKIYVTITNMEESVPVAEYALLNDKTEDEMINLLLASSALPVVYDAVEINGIKYRDGGIADNVPKKPLIESGVENIIVVRLKPGETVIKEEDTGHIIEISPSHDLGDFFSGTINFENKSILYRMELGYLDAMKILVEEEKRR